MLRRTAAIVVSLWLLLGASAAAQEPTRLAMRLDASHAAQEPARLALLIGNESYGQEAGRSRTPETTSRSSRARS